MVPDTYDPVSSSGRVMDPGSGTDAVGYVGIDGGTIVAVTKDATSGTRTIDASGLVVAYHRNMGRTYKDIFVAATLEGLTQERYEELTRSTLGTQVLFNAATDDDRWKDDC